MSKFGYVGGGSEPVEIGPRFLKAKKWAAELTLAERVAVEVGAELILSDAAYQVAKITGPGFRLVLYPHRTTAGNTHLRVRDENSKDRHAALAMMVALDNAAGLNCTFAHKRTQQEPV